MSDAPDPGRRWRERLPAAFRERLAAMRSNDAYRQTLAGLWLLEAGGARVGLPVSLPALGLSPDGRPTLGEGPVFSISHSGEYCVCAIAAEGLLGVDLERERPLDLGRLQRLLSAEERAAAAADHRAFFPAWTAREATVKATGRVGLRRLGRVRLTGDRARIDGTILHLQRPGFAAGYALCVAGDVPATPITPIAVKPPA